MNNQTSSLEFSHFPVMLNDIFKISPPSIEKNYIDCTFGGGGYSKEILKFDKTKVQAIDRDKKVLAEAKELERKFPRRFKFHQLKFSELEAISINNVDTVIFDLGLSSEWHYRQLNIELSSNVCCPQLSSKVYNCSQACFRPLYSPFHAIP